MMIKTMMIPMMMMMMMIMVMIITIISTKYKLFQLQTQLFVLFALHFQIVKRVIIMMIMITMMMMINNDINVFCTVVLIEDAVDPGCR